MIYYLSYFIVYVFVHVHVCVTCVCSACRGKKSALGHLEIVPDGCGLPCRIWDQNADHLHEKPVLLTANSSFQPLIQAQYGLQLFSDTL